MKTTQERKVYSTNQRKLRPSRNDHYKNNGPRRNQFWQFHSKRQGDYSEDVMALVTLNFLCFDV